MEPNDAPSIFAGKYVGDLMKIEQALTAATFRGAEKAIGSVPLDERYIDNIAQAAAEYRRAKRELLALTTKACPDGDPALQAAAENVNQARIAVKQAIRV
jgi:hypothetical protein